MSNNINFGENEKEWAEVVNRVELEAIRVVIEINIEGKTEKLVDKLSKG